MTARPQSPPRHAWSQATREPVHLPGSRTEISHHPNDDLGGNTAAAASVVSGLNAMSLSTIVSVDEAERIVESLTSFPVEEVGSSKFLNLYGYQVERLSLQAHASAQQQSGDEYVVEAVLTFGKLPVLVRTLLAVEAWRTYVLNPKEGDSVLAPMVAKNGNALRCAFTLHVETTIVGLLNLILYRRESCVEMDGETAVALVDYCARCMSALATPLEKNSMVRRQKEPETSAQLTERLKNRSSLEEINDTLLDTEYRTAVAATSLSRYLCEHIESLPLGAQTRILDTHDFLIMITPLINEPPWTRRRCSGKEGDRAVVWEKLVDNRWQEVPPSDLLQMTKCEAQCWLAVFHLTCSKLCRERYGLNVFRKEQLLRLRKFLNDVVLDQLPVLADVMRYMDELALMNVPESTTGQGSALLMQQVPIVRDSLVRGKDWTEVAKRQYRDIFSLVTDAKDEELRRISTVYSEDGIEGILGEAVPFEPTSQTLGEITISVEKDDALEETFILKPAEGGKTVVQTPHGSFSRRKMDVIRIDQETAVPVPSDSKVTANVSFIGESDYSTTLQSDGLHLPCPETSERTADVIDTIPSKEWRQLGSLQEKLVLQLGFKRLSTGNAQKEGMQLHCYMLEQAFVSQPCAD